jgi:hypothetical protein
MARCDQDNTAVRATLRGAGPTTSAPRSGNDARGELFEHNRPLPNELRCSALKKDGSDALSYLGRLLCGGSLLAALEIKRSSKFTLRSERLCGPY